MVFTGGTRGLIIFTWTMRSFIGLMPALGFDTRYYTHTALVADSQLGKIMEKRYRYFESRKV